MSRKSKNAALPEFVSRQVTEARRFFLNLTPDHRSPLEVVCGGVERMRRDYVVDREDFPYFALELVAEGQGALVIGGRAYRLSAGSVFAYGPRAQHTIRNDSEVGMRKYYVDFVGRQARRLLEESGLLTGGDYRRLEVGGLHELTDLFDLLIQDGTEGGPDAAAVCEVLVQLLLRKARQRSLPAGATVPKSFSTYQRIRQHIETHFLELHTAQDVAAACGVTPVYLSRLFGRFSDRGAYQFLLQRKMNFAAGLLMNEGLLVRDVADRLSFRDAFQFSRAFKRVYGIPPSQLGIVESDPA